MRPVSLPVISETNKLSIFQLRHGQGQRVTRPALSLRGGSKSGPGRRWKSSLITTQTLLDGILTVTLIPTLRPTSTLALLRQRLYLTSEAPLKLSHVYYNLTIYVLPQTDNHFTTTAY